MAGMIAIVDYGVGNLFSLKCSLEHIGARCRVTDNPKALDDASAVILPGVGAFGDAVGKLRGRGMEARVLRQVEKGKPLLGICLGMQLLYETSHEYGQHKGLGLIKGTVRQLTPQVLGGPLKVPHMGWNSLTFNKESPLLKYISEGEYVYYVHSFYAAVSPATAAASRYGEAEITGVAQEGLVLGTQFHPEKSGEVGLRILRAFAEMGG